MFRFNPRLVELCRASRNGLTEKNLGKEMCDVAPEMRVLAINKLLSEGKIELCKQGTQLLYRLKEPDKNKNLDDEEKVVLSIIKESGNIGIWMRDIRYKSNLSMTILNKVVNAMEKRKVIKVVRSVSAPKKKTYMLFDLKPDESVSGGAWYSHDQDFEVEFVDILNTQCFNFLQEKVRSSRAAFFRNYANLCDSLCPGKSCCS